MGFGPSVTRVRSELVSASPPGPMRWSVTAARPIEAIEMPSTKRATGAGTRCHTAARPMPRNGSIGMR